MVIIIDILHISALKILTRIGVYDWEQRILQPVLIDIEIEMIDRMYDETLSSTIDYDFLCSYVTNFVESSRFVLIETLAEQVAAMIRNNTEYAEKISVRVSKPLAIKNTACVSFSLVR